MAVFLKKKTSQERGPQGPKLGLYLFLVLINAAGFKPTESCTKLEETETNPKGKAIPKSQHNYVDDMTQCVSVNHKEDAKIIPIQIPVHQRKQHEIYGHVNLPYPTSLISSILTSTQNPRKAQEHDQNWV